MDSNIRHLVPQDVYSMVCSSIRKMAMASPIRMRAMIRVSATMSLTSDIIPAQGAHLGGGFPGFRFRRAGVNQGAV